LEKADWKLFKRI